MAPSQLLPALLTGLALAATAAEQATRPNILVLTLEDVSAHEIGCYGNAAVRTPNMDALAANGVQYLRAWSTGAQCSPARSCLTTGGYATTWGMDLHRGRIAVPEGLHYTLPLRQAGYFCSNDSKNDFNSHGDDGIWDVCTRGASPASRKRQPDQPFLAVVNSMSTHMGSVIGSEDRSPVRAATTVGMSPPPPHVPDLPELRADQQRHFTAIEKADAWVGEQITRLHQAGHAEDTVVILFSDHGGCVPRGKGFPFETGLRVPFIVHAPPRWQHLLTEPPGTRSQRLIGFIDVGPTLLSLAGLKPPPSMQGRAFLGPHAVEPPRYQFGFVSNSGDHFVPARTVTDGRYTYIRWYTPWLPNALRNFYQWRMDGNRAWDRWVLEGGDRADWLQPYRPRPGEQLFAVESDPWQMHDLANDPNHAKILHDLRKAIADHIRDSGDLGFWPRGLRHGGPVEDRWGQEISGGKPFIERVMAEDGLLAEVHAAADLASDGNPAAIERMQTLLQNPQPVLRFWGACGLAHVARRGLLAEAPAILLAALGDAEPEVATTVAFALCYSGLEDAGLEALVSAAEQGVVPALSMLEALSLDPLRRPALIRHAARLQAAMDQRPLPIRGILVNLGALPLDQLYGGYSAGD